MAFVIQPAAGQLAHHGGRKLYASSALSLGFRYGPKSCIVRSQGRVKPTLANPLSTPRCVAVSAGKIEKLTGEELEIAIGDRSKPMIIDFFATWCGPCVMLAKELEQVAEQLGDEVRIVKVDVDENSQLATALRIEGLPTIIFIPKDNEKPALRTEGLLPAQQIVEIVKEL